MDVFCETLEDLGFKPRMSRQLGGSWLVVLDGPPAQESELSRAASISGAELHSISRQPLEAPKTYRSRQVRSLDARRKLERKRDGLAALADRLRDQASFLAAEADALEERAAQAKTTQELKWPQWAGAVDDLAISIQTAALDEYCARQYGR